MTLITVHDVSRSAVIDSPMWAADDYPADPQPLPWPQPKPHPAGPTGPRVAPVDPARLFAELEIRLAHQGSAPGVGYRRLDALAAVKAYLRAADIPMASAT